MSQKAAEENLAFSINILDSAGRKAKVAKLLDLFDLADHYPFNYQEGHARAYWQKS